jgi:hypothetical protein
MNISEILRKIPEDKLYNNPKIKDNFSKDKLELLEKLKEMLSQKRKEMLSQRRKNL